MDESDDLLREALGMSSRPAPTSLVAGQVIEETYRIEGEIGRGGMGRVYRARDVRLGRDVALKLLTSVIAERDARLAREAAALARLAHPNVVAVFAIGTWTGHPWIAMEYVPGGTAREWLEAEPRSPRAILAIYIAAARGLAAAHSAGLVHRDFKPENVLVGDDKRVRVADFGLARDVDATASAPGNRGGSALDPLTRTGVVLGTPAYMAPEQRVGERVRPAADQFAFAVALWEALAGERPFGGDTTYEIDAAIAKAAVRKPPATMPNHVARALRRALAADPAARWPSMSALADDLARDPARRRRRVALVAGGGAILAIGGIAVGTLRASDAALEVCTGGSQEMAELWSAPAQLASHLRSLGPYGVAQADRIDAQLTGYAKRWVGASREACFAKERRDLTPELFERNVGCLSRTKAAFQTMLQVLHGVKRDELPDAAAAVIRLPDATRCLLETRTATVDPPDPGIAALATRISNDIEGVRMKALAQTAGAVEDARSIVARAEALGYKPLVARANLEHGRVLMLRGFEDDAIPVLDRATRIGFEANDPITAIEAYAQQIYAVSVTPKLPANARDRLGAIEMAESIARGLGPLGNFARILLFNNIGTVRLNAQDPAGARTWFELALRERARVGAKQLELTIIPGNLARVTDDPVERERLVAQQNAELADLVGADHPSVLNARSSSVFLIGNPLQLRTELADICGRYQKWHAHLAKQIAVCAYELAWLDEERGDLAGARTWVSAVTFKDGLEYVNATGLHLFLDGKDEQAAREMLAKADELLQQADPWSRWKAVDALLVAGLAQLRLDRRADAIATLERAEKTLHALALGKLAFYQRRVARTQRVLAGLHATTRRARAHELAAAALGFYRTVGGYEDAVTELEAIELETRSR
jgi:hypothetical protein